MSNTVTSHILVHDDGKLTVEDVNIAVHGEHPLPKSGEDENYYSARKSKDSEWINVRTKWSAPVGAIARLAYEKRVNLTMEFDSLDNAEVGNMQFFHKRIGLEDGVSLLDYYRPGAVPQEVQDEAKKLLRQRGEEVKATFGVEEAE
jgi:hypothetical protein